MNGMAKTLIIAEPGATAEGDWANYLKLIYTAAECGASCWKPQWTSNPAKMLERRHIGPDHPQRRIYERAYGWLHFPVEWHQDFSTLCQKLGMSYACSVYLPEDVATIASFVDYLKIASFENRDRSMQQACRMCFAGLESNRVIISTGMSPSDWEWRSYVPYSRRLHCVSAYPAPLDAMNISVEGFDGLSDHSRHLLAGALAVACGASIVETHYRLDECDEHNPDYAVAFSPKEFTQYVQNIRDAEIMLGSGVKERQPCEDWALPYRVTS